MRLAHISTVLLLRPLKNLIDANNIGKLKNNFLFIKEFDNEYLFAKKINKIKIPKSEGLKNK